MVDLHVSGNIPNLHVAGLTADEVKEDVVPDLVRKDELALTRGDVGVELAIEEYLAAIGGGRKAVTVICGNNGEAQKHLPNERVLLKQLPTGNFKPLGNLALDFLDINLFCHFLDSPIGKLMGVPLNPSLSHNTHIIPYLAVRCQ